MYDHIFHFIWFFDCYLCFINFFGRAERNFLKNVLNLKGVSIDVGMLWFITVVVIPCISGYILMRTRKHFGKLAMTELQYQEIIILQSLLTDLKINHSEFGRMVQSCAAVTDLVIFIMASGTVL